MSQFVPQNETQTRRNAMLRSAFCSLVQGALEAPDTIEVMVNPDGGVWIETAGVGLIKLQKSLTAVDRERVIRLVASSIGDTADPKAAIVSAELPGSGERFEGCLPPVSTAPCFAIRKPAPQRFALGDYVDQGQLAPAIADALKASIVTHDNILIAGGTSSGKTTFTNALLAEPFLQNERLIILEDTRELKCAGPNSVELRTHRGHTSLRDLVRSTLRLRPDRIIVGEVRGPEALDLLKAWNTGHPGGITTLHANSAYGALRRLEQLTLEATPRATFELIAEAIDVVVFMRRANGRRRVEEALRVTGFDGERYETAPLVTRPLSLIPDTRVLEGTE